MKRYLLLLLAPLLLAAQSYIPLTATQTGVDGENLADTPLSDPIHMEASGYITNQLSLTFAVTAGTSTRIQVTCYESELKTSAYAQVSFCDTAPTSNCQPDVREYTLADYTAVGGVLYIPSRWGIKKAFAKCSADDPDDGNGTVVITGTRSWQ